MECNRRPSDIENINEISFFLFEEILCKRRSGLAYELQNGKFFRREIRKEKDKVQTSSSPYIYKMCFVLVTDVVMDKR